MRRAGESSSWSSRGAVGKMTRFSGQTVLQSREGCCGSRAGVDAREQHGGGHGLDGSVVGQSHTQVELAGSKLTKPKSVVWALWPFLVSMDFLPLLVPWDLLVFLGSSVGWVQKDNQNSLSTVRWSVLDQITQNLQRRLEPGIGLRSKEVAVG